MPRHRRIIGASLLALTVASGCSQGTWGEKHGIKDAPIDRKTIHNEPATIINFPDGFMNVARKCVDGDGIYAHTREAAPVVVPNDPACSESR